MVALFFSRCFSQQSSFATRAPFRWRCSSGGWKSVCSFSEWSASRRLAASFSAARVRVIAFSMLRHIFERVEQVVARVRHPSRGLPTSSPAETGSARCRRPSAVASIVRSVLAILVPSASRRALRSEADKARTFIHGIKYLRFDCSHWRNRERVQFMRGAEASSYSNRTNWKKKTKAQQISLEK